MKINQYKETTVDAKSQKVMIWAGVLLSVVYSIGYAFLMNFFPPPAPTLGAEAVVRLYTESNLQFRIGVALMLVGGCFILPWTVVISAQMARYEKGIPIWAIMQGLAGAIQTTLFFLPPVFWGVAAFSPERDPALTLLMHEVGFIIFITPVCVIALVFIPIMVICFFKKNDPYSAFPRWMGYFTLFMTIETQLGVAALLFKSGPFAWNGLFPFYLPIVIYGAWMSTMVVTLTRAINHQEKQNLS